MCYCFDCGTYGRYCTNDNCTNSLCPECLDERMGQEDEKDWDESKQRLGENGG